MEQLGLKDFLEEETMVKWKESGEVSGEVILNQLNEISSSKKKILIERMLSLIVFQSQRLNIIAEVINGKPKASKEDAEIEGELNGGNRTQSA